MIELFANDLPALIVVQPLLAALLCLFVGQRLAWAWTMANVGPLFVLICLMLGQVMSSGDPSGISYVMGRWPAQWGIEYRIDHLNGMVMLIIGAIGVVTTFYARLSIPTEVAADRLHIFYSIWMLCLVGLLGQTVTGDAFNVYVMIEISALTIYTLIAMGMHRDRRALVAAIRYLILGSIGATFILLGIGYLLMETGTLNMADMAQQLRANPEVLEKKTVLVAFVFLIVGMGVKMALFPLHMWLPNAYGFAPSAVSAMLAATATKVGVYIGIRFLFTVFGYEFSFASSLPGSNLLAFFACAGILWCSITAIRQTNIKLLLAYSSVAQIGYMVLGFALHNQPGVTGSVIHLFNHALTKGGMFLALGCVIYRLGGANLENLRGLGRKMPWTMAAFTAGGFGLIGFPLTAGFISKWYLIQGCILGGYYFAAIVVLVGSLLAVIYVWKVVEAIYFQEPKEGITYKEAPFSMVLATWVLIAGSIYFGLDANLTATVAGSAAEALIPADAPVSGVAAEAAP